MDALLPQITGAQKKNFPAQKKNFPARAAGTSAVGASRAWHGLAAMKEAAVWPDETDLAHRLSKVSFIP
jgi:predicted oxidoreductase (fatty acid repression mutant protein)